MSKQVEKFQVILKSGKYGDKLYDTPQEAIRSVGGIKNVFDIKPVILMEDFTSADGRNTSRGKMFAGRKGRNHNARRNFR